MIDYDPDDDEDHDDHDRDYHGDDEDDEAEADGDHGDGPDRDVSQARSTLTGPYVEKLKHFAQALGIDTDKVACCCL